MNCTEAFLQTPKKDQARLQTQFAGFIRGVTDVPMLLSFPLGAMDRTRKMSEGEFETLIDNNRRLVSNRLDPDYEPPGSAGKAKAQEAPAQEEAPKATPEPDSDTKKDEPKKRKTRYGSMDYTPRDGHED